MEWMKEKEKQLSSRHLKKSRCTDDDDEQKVGLVPFSDYLLLWNFAGKVSDCVDHSMLLARKCQCTKQPPAGKFGLGKKMIKRAKIFAGAINKQHQCIDQLLSATEKSIAEKRKIGCLFCTSPVGKIRLKI
ncbi:hypothetical protein T02_15863 [Trichinella nativa]|uniref:Uncharacterized protein n=1 Tax=Trichinella nativa TaxID=6335 RepID=A0A0V1LSP7_9BILA|nr:hypothetical protein T02_15863 [Trichinella nativa]